MRGKITRTSCLLACLLLSGSVAAQAEKNVHCTVPSAAGKAHRPAGDAKAPLVSVPADVACAPSTSSFTASDMALAMALLACILAFCGHVGRRRRSGKVILS